MVLWRSAAHQLWLPQLEATKPGCRRLYFFSRTPPNSAVAGAGTLPSNWGNLSSLQYLGIAANAFTGSLVAGVESADATGAFKQIITPVMQLRHVCTSQGCILVLCLHPT